MSNHSEPFPLPRRLRVFFAILGFFCFAAVAFAQNQNWDNWLKKADSFRAFRTDGFCFDYTLTDSADGTSSMRIYLKKNDRNVVLSVYTSPAKLKGRRVLVQGNAFWLFDHNMHDSIRISARQMMFGQASAGDVTRIAYSDSYRVDQGTIDDDKVRLELSALPGKEVSYPKVSLFLRARDGRPLRAELFSATGTLLKTIHYEKFELIDEHELLTAFRIVNEINKEESEVQLSNFSPETLADRFFSREGMKALP